LGKGAENKIMKSINLAKKHLPELIVGSLFLLSYLPTFLWMGDRWFAKDSYYSHGILVPFVTGYLIWQRRKDLARTSKKSSALAVPLVISGVLIHLGSSIFRVYFTSAFSILIVLAGIILHFYGVKILRKIVFPLSFLFFMMPLPLIVIVNISFQMKLFAAEIARKVLQEMGFVVMREGSIIRMQHAYVIVDDVCSGLRSLISLAALGSIFAYWLKAPMWRRVLLFFSTIPIAVVTNVCRVVFLSAVSEIWGPQYASGFVHDLTGFLVFALAFVMLYAVMKLME
jgi:exosortase